MDAPQLDASASDASAEDDAADEPDAPSPPQDASSDDAVAFDAAFDGGPDRDAASPPGDGGALDAAAANACEAAGGRCVTPGPRACPRGLLGDPDLYGCGTGEGIACCLPANTPPRCLRVGTREEGWYRADGSLVCVARCAGAMAVCDAVGTRSEGWYADAESAGCDSIPVPRLIEWANCSR